MRRHPQRSGFDTYRLLVESFRNLRARWFATIVRLPFAAALALLVIGFTHDDLASIQRETERQQAEGYSAWVAAGVGSEAILSATRCDQLSSLNGIISAGAILESSVVSVATRPAARYDLEVVTPGMIQMLWPGMSVPSSAGLLVGSDAAAELGLSAHARISTSDTAAPDSSSLNVVAVVMPPSPRDGSANRKIFSVKEPIGNVTTCYVSSEPGSSFSVGALLPGWFPVGSGVVAAPYVLDARTSAPQDLYDDRSSRWLAVAAGAVMLVLHVSFVSARREEYSLYLLLGAAKMQLAAIILFEGIVCLIAPVSLGATVALVVIDKPVAELALDGIVVALAQIAFASACAMGLAFLAVRPWRAVDNMKER